MYGPVSANPNISAQQSSVPRSDVSKVRRSRFLFSVEKEFEICGPPCVRCFQRVERGEHSDDRGLVIGRRPRVESPFRVELFAALWKRNDSPARFERLVSERGLKRIARPFRRINGPFVVMRGETDGSSRAGRLQFA